MTKHVSRRSAVIAALAVILLMVAAAPTAIAHLRGWASAVSHSPRAGAPHVAAGPAATSEPLQETGPAVVRLVTQDLTPSTQLHLTASGFLPKEPLVVSVEDLQGGHTYEQVTLAAGKDGRVHDTALAAPPQLGDGTYDVLVVGSLSHRTASVTFRMHTIPPVVALDAYTAAPGQAVGFLGRGFIAGEEVVVYLGKSTAPLVHVKAADDGTVTGRLTVPALQAGNYTLTMVGSVSQTPISVGFSVQGYAPWVVLNRYALTSGQGLGFIGQDFAPNEPVLVYLNGTTGNPVLTLTADTSGRVVQQDSWVPSGVSGSNVLTFVGQWSKTSTTADFTVLPSAQPSPTVTAP